ncbi:MAG: flagellar assembly protein FliW [Nitrospirae bacterium YQR-1]
MYNMLSYGMGGRQRTSGGLMRFNTTRFDMVEIDDDKVITFPRGIIGFKDLKHFCILPYKEPVKWLHATDDPDVAFIVTDPFEFFPYYSFRIEDFVEEYLGCNNVEDILVLVILNVDGKKLYANLKSPIIINTSNMKGAHLVLSDDSIPIRTLVANPLAAPQAAYC